MARTRGLWSSSLAPFVIGLAIPVSAAAQVPSGSIAGVVADASGSAIPQVEVRVANVQTDEQRIVTTSPAGLYSAALLPPGLYRVSVQANGFKRLEQLITVAPGRVTSADFQLSVGDVTETIAVSSAAPSISRTRHEIDSIVTREEIERVPLNGRNFLELAKLEPGVTPPVRGASNRMFVAALGAGLQTLPRVGAARTTVDGASVSTIGAIGAVLQVSQDAVQEFQMATANFDPGTSLTTAAAVNIVSRSGSNTMHGAGVAFYRDQYLAAYPGLLFDPRNPDPFFRRSQFGISAGGPVRKDRTFFFGSYERTNQRGVVSVQPAAPEFAGLGGIFPSPASGDQLTVRGDVKPSSRNVLFMRYTSDDNGMFAPANDRTDLLPSAWSRSANRVRQSLAAMTTVLSDRIVNDVRFSYFTMRLTEQPTEALDCTVCFGLGAPRVTVQGAGVSFGDATTLAVSGRRDELVDTLAWQVGRHLLQFGVDWERSRSRSSQLALDPAQITLWSPASVQQRNPAFTLPLVFATVADVLALPLRSFLTAVGSPQELEAGFAPDRRLDLVRLYAADTIRVGPRLTASAGLAWSYEPNVLNALTKPALLAPILGADGLHAPPATAAHFSPTAGFAWTLRSDGKTVVRGGGGQYFDPAGSTNPISLSNERFLLFPAGTGRLTVSGSSIVDPATGLPLNFVTPTSFTGSDLVGRLEQIRGQLAASLDSNNRSFTVRNLDRLKEAATDLFDPNYTTPSALHAAIGIQREFGRGTVLTADVVWKAFRHTFIDGIDMNRFDSATGPIIPRCSSAQVHDDAAVCSAGPMLFDTTSGHAQYRGLLVRLQSRAFRQGQFLLSYALGSDTGTNGTAPGAGFDLDHWSQNNGPLPTDFRHVVNGYGNVNLPWGLVTAFNISAHSPPPFSVYVGGMDFNGDGTANDLLPGSTVGAFGGRLGKADLMRLVDAYNRDFAGRKFPVGGAPTTAPTLTLPSSYGFGDSFVTVDLRLSKQVRLGSMHLDLIGEVFNLFNTVNLTGFNGDLTNPSTFGQPTGRSSPVFGSGGPRAAQLAARVSF